MTTSTKTQRHSPPRDLALSSGTTVARVKGRTGDCPKHGVQPIDERWQCVKCRREDARWALRTARETLDCADSIVCTCGIWDEGDWRGDLELPHYDSASISLDGFSVDELTAVGG